MQTKINLTIAVSGIHRAVSHEWTLQHLSQEKFNFSFILINSHDSEMEQFLIRHNVPYLLAQFRSKKDLPGAVWRILRFLRRQKTQVIHTHLFEANLAGLLAAWLAGIKRRIYTRHHSTIHHVYFPGYVKYDRWVNHLATDIVAVSSMVRDVLVAKEGVAARKVHLVPHGFRFEEFEGVQAERVERLHQKYGIGERKPVIGVISRYTGWKGVQHIIPAFKSLLTDYPGAVLVLANAQGDYAVEIRRHLASLKPEQFIEIDFEPDFIALYRLFTVFVHVPIDNHSEAFGQTYVEALLSGVPSVFTLSGIACEFIRHRNNAYVVDYNSPAQVYEGMKTLLVDDALRERLSAQGKADVLARFPLQLMLERFEKLYSR